MVQAGPIQQRPPRLLWAVLLSVALAVRIAAVILLLPKSIAVTGPLTYEHGAIAENLLAGRGFSVWYLGTEGPTSQQAPWVPFVLAGCYAAFGVGSPAALVAYQLLQCLAGVGLVAATVRLTWSLVPEHRGCGWIAGWLAALFPPHIYMVTHVQAAPWAALGLTMLLAAACNRSAPLTWRRTFTLGALSGWLLLVDPILVLAMPIVGLALLVNADVKPTGDRSTRTLLHRCIRPTVIGLTTLLVIAPWLARNFVVHGEFVFVKASFGYALWQGNNELSYGTDKIPKRSAAEIASEHDGSLGARNAALWEARHETIYIDDILLKPNGYRELIGLSEPARSRVLGEKAKQWIMDHPGDYVRLSLQRLRYFLLWDATNPKAAHPIYRGSSIFWLTLAFIGLIAALPRRRRLWPTIAVFAVITAFHALTITSARFRIPLEPLGFAWGAIGFGPAVRSIGLRVVAAWRSALEETPPAVSERVPLRGPHRRRSRADLPERTKRH